MQISDLQAAAATANEARLAVAQLNTELEILAETSEPAMRVISDLLDKALLLLQTTERLTRAQP